MVHLADNHRFRWLQIAAIIALAAYWLAMFIGTHAPRVPQAPFGHIDKWLHFGAFAGLAFLLGLCRSLFSALRARGYATIVALLAAYGAFDELSQPSFKRSAEWGDWLVDLAGIAAGLASFAAIRWLAPTAGATRQTIRAEAPLTGTWYPSLPDRQATLEDSRAH